MMTEKHTSEFHAWHFFVLITLSMGAAYLTPRWLLAGKPDPVLNIGSQILALSIVAYFAIAVYAVESMARRRK